MEDEGPWRPRCLPPSARPATTDSPGSLCTRLVYSTVPCLGQTDRHQPLESRDLSSRPPDVAPPMRGRCLEVRCPSGPLGTWSWTCSECPWALSPGGFETRLNQSVFLFRSGESQNKSLYFNLHFLRFHSPVASVHVGYLGVPDFEAHLAVVPGPASDFRDGEWAQSAPTG